MPVDQISKKYGINFQALADGVYNMMPEDDKYIVKAGMTPKNWLDMFMKNLKEIYIRKNYPKWSDILVNDGIKHIKKEIISEWENAFSLALLKHCKI